MKRDYEEGYKSGVLHDDENILCRENLIKMESGIKSEYNYIRDYWQGYKDGLKRLYSRT
jgi:hypothetical protein